MTFRANTIGRIVPTPLFKPNPAYPALGTIDIGPTIKHHMPHVVIVNPPIQTL